MTERSDAQKAADKRYREKVKSSVVKWGTQLKKEEAQGIDDIIHAHGMNRAQFLRWAAAQLSGENN